MANPQPDKFVKISSEIMDALCKNRIRAEYRQVLDAIIRQTYGFNKKTAPISTKKFIQMTGLKRHTVHKARKWLKDNKFITVTDKGDSYFLTYSIQKNYEEWEVLPKKVTVTQKGDRCNPKRSQSVTQKGHTLISIDNRQRSIDSKKPFEHDFFKDKDFSELWTAYLDMRTKKKKPATDKAVELVLKTLTKFGLPMAKASLEESIKNSWTDVYEPKNYSKKRKDTMSCQ